MIDIIKNLLFRVLHGFKGYPKQIQNIPFRIDESLRRFNTGGEEVVQDVLKSKLKSGDVYIDVGANFGLHALLAAHYVGPSGKVIAFEPVPANIRLLHRNLELNGFSSRSQIFECALTSTGGGEMEMTIEPGLSPAASLAENFKGEKISVPTRTLDDCLAQAPCRPKLVKIDVEGAEQEVLKGATEILKQGPDLLIEVHTFALPAFRSSPEQIKQYLAGFGYAEERLGDMQSHLGHYYHALFRIPS